MFVYLVYSSDLFPNIDLGLNNIYLHNISFTFHASEKKCIIKCRWIICVKFVKKLKRLDCAVHSFNSFFFFEGGDLMILTSYWDMAFHLYFPWCFCSLFYALLPKNYKLNRSFNTYTVEIATRQKFRIFFISQVPYFFQE